MEITRRTFCHMAAAVACSEAVQARPSTTLRPEFVARVVSRVIHLDLILHNEGAAAVDVLMGRGAGSAITVQGQLDRWSLTTEAPQEKEMMTRAGPRLIWRPVPAGGKLAAGTFLLALPEAAKSKLPAAATFVARLETNQGTLQLKAEGITLSHS